MIAQRGRCAARYGWASLAVLLTAMMGLVATPSPAGDRPEEPLPRAQKLAAVLQEASRLLDEAQVSYVFGGHQLGDSQACTQCNQCLETRHPVPAARLRVCAMCENCSLDCSHFTELVFRTAGVPYPYLETGRMRTLSATALRLRYHLLDIGTDPRLALAGDLLVYDGHVVLLERVAVPTLGGVVRGDIIHATGGGAGGRAIRRPGEGIQRERRADLAGFRGPLRRILRHERLGPGPAPAAEADPALSLPAPSTAWPSPLPARLRPVLKASGEES